MYAIFFLANHIYRSLTYVHRQAKGIPIPNANTLVYLLSGARYGNGSAAQEPFSFS